MAWIESHESLKDHPKLHEVCAALKAERPTVIGHLHLLWWWCINYALDGSLKYNNVQIARAAMWEGDADVFVNSLISAGFIDRDGDILRIHDWQDFCGSLIDKRLEREESRKRGSRTAAKRRKAAATSRRSAPNPTNHTQPTIPTEPTQPIPDALASVPGFTDSWDEWESYKRELKKPLTTTTRKKQWQFLARQPDPVAVLAQSMENQWIGLFPLKENRNAAAHSTRNQGRPGKSDVLPGSIETTARAAERILAARGEGRRSDG